MITIDALTERNLIEDHSKRMDVENWWVAALISFKRKPTLFRMVSNHMGVALTDEPTSAPITESLTWNGYYPSVQVMLDKLSYDSELLKLFLYESAREMLDFWQQAVADTTMPEPFQRKADL